MAKPFNVRMDDELRAEIDKRVAAGDAANASAWAREALAGVVELGGLSQLRTALDLTGRGGRLQPHPVRSLQLSSRSIATAEVCDHPREKRRQLPYHEQCRACGATIHDLP